MVQPFLPSVVADGDLVDVVHPHPQSHAVKKQAKPGDFNASKTTTEAQWCDDDMTLEERAFAERAMDAAAMVWGQRNIHSRLYPRVDMVRDLNGAWAVSELEMVEPELWFRMCPDAAGVLAIWAIAEHLTQPSA